MWWTRALILAALAVVLGVPFLVRRPAESEQGAASGANVRTLIVVTPHVEQIRAEFSAAFDDWHRRRFGEAVRIDWRAGGGTSEIVKQLEAQYTAAIRNGLIRIDDSGAPAADPGAIGFDVMFGGGSYDHGRVKRGVTLRLGGGDRAREVRISMSAPAGFTQEQLDDWYGENAIGAQHLYDPDQHWLGTALSGFGIVYNRDVLRELGLPEPRAFSDLADPRYAGLLALADPRQSGSVTTTYESILNKEGWDEGWRILRDLCANARYYATSSVRPPIDVSQGDAAAGLAIDFYGRGQAQAIMRPGETPETCRVGYVDPEGAVYIDADPVSILLGGPDPVLARRFVEFCMSEEGQALWQMRATTTPAGASNPIGESGEPLGPRWYELRRMPARRVMYEKYADSFVDRANPFELAADVRPRGWRDAIAVLMGAFGIDTAEEQHEAWAALIAARADPSFPADALAEMERAFYAMPVHVSRPGAATPAELASMSREAKTVFAGLRPPTLPALADRLPVLRAGGKLPPHVVAELERLVAGRSEAERSDQLRLELNAANYEAIAIDTDRWRDPQWAARAKIAYTTFFREQYARVVELARSASAAAPTMR